MWNLEGKQNFIEIRIPVSVSGTEESGFQVPDQESGFEEAEKEGSI